MNSELIAYYANLIILQYKNKPNAKNTIVSIIKSLMIYDIINEVENGYDIDTAIGIQLDILAKYIGVDRIATGVDFTRTYFGFVDYNEPEPYTGIAGLISYNEFNPPDAQLLEYNSDQQSLYTLNDQELKILLKLKIAQNNSNHSTAQIDQIFYDFLPNQAIFTDNLDMTVSYIFDDNLQRIIDVAISQKILPKPAAVGIQVSFVPDIENIFSMMRYDYIIPADFSQGFIGYADNPFGTFLRY